MFCSSAFQDGAGAAIDKAEEDEVFTLAKQDRRLRSIRSDFIDCLIGNRMQLEDFESNIWQPFINGNKDPIMRLGFLPERLVENGNRRLITKYTQVVYYLTFKRHLCNNPLKTCELPASTAA